MAIITHVSGPAAICINDGTGLETLGWSVDGVTIRDTLITEPVYVDTYFKTAYDFQYSLVESEIECELVVWEWAVLNTIRSYVPVGGTPGVFGPAGSLFVQQGYTFLLLITSTPAGVGVTGVENCRTYPKAFLIDAMESKMGTERQIWKLKFRAMPYQELSSTSGVVLFNTDCTGS